MCPTVNISKYIICVMCTVIWMKVVGGFVNRARRVVESTVVGFPFLLPFFVGEIRELIK